MTKEEFIDLFCKDCDAQLCGGPGDGLYFEGCEVKHFSEKSISEVKDIIEKI